MDKKPSTSDSNPESEEDNSDFEREGHFSLPAPSKPLNVSSGAMKLRSWLNKTFKIQMTDGRTLIGAFLCTDRDANIILGSCSEFLPADSDTAPNEDPRMLGLVMIPGKHIVSVHIDENEPHNVRSESTSNDRLFENVG